MAKIEILLPAMGEGVIEATLTKWMVKEGDSVKEDDSLVEIATDKVDSEIPAPEDGIIEKIVADEEAVIKVGQIIAILSTGSEEPALERPAVMEMVKEIKDEIEEKSTKEDKDIGQALESGNQLINRTPSGKFLSPLVRKIALEENIVAEELEQIQGSGKDSRITKQDIMLYLENRKKGISDTANVIRSKTPDSVPEKERPNEKPLATFIKGTDEDEIIEMGRIRKIIAERMVQSKQTSPHVTSFIEADVTNLVHWRNRIKDEFFKKENQKITFTPLFIEAAAKALRDFPFVNISVDGSRIIKKKSINIGMATALPSGNLIVPVIKNADEKNLVGLAKSVNELATRARGNQLNPDEITGGTFTVTNFGTFQNLTGTPIINQPEVAILGVGAIVKKPAVIETEMGDTVGIRHKMILSLAYDHRVIDGALGGMFLKKVADYLEQFDYNREI